MSPPSLARQCRLATWPLATVRNNLTPSDMESVCQRQDVPLQFRCTHRPPHLRLGGAVVDGDAVREDDGKAAAVSREFDRLGWDAARRTRANACADVY